MYTGGICIYIRHTYMALIYTKPWINNNTDAGLHVVIELVGEHMYTLTLCVCMCVCAYPGVEFPSRLVRRPYLLSKRRHCPVERTTIEPASRVLRT